jgi:hypothetical protein
MFEKYAARCNEIKLDALQRGPGDRLKEGLSYLVNEVL